jgi:hypothetical protein
MGTPFLKSYDRLVDLVDDLDKLDDALVICTTNADHCTPESPAFLREPGDFLPGDKGRILHEYLLEVSLAKDVIRAWSFARANRKPTEREKCDAIIYYAKYDAYLLPENERGEAEKRGNRS